MAENWDLAGYSDRDGKLGKTIPTGRILVPAQIWIEDDSLMWHISPYYDCQPTDLVPPKILLNGFARLWQAKDGEILRFAQRYGPLWEDGISAEGQEPLYRWRELSLNITRLLHIGAELSRGRRIQRQLWASFEPFEEKRLDDLESLNGSRVELMLR